MKYIFARRPHQTQPTKKPRWFQRREICRSLLAKVLARFADKCQVAQARQQKGGEPMWCSSNGIWRDGTPRQYKRGTLDELSQDPLSWVSMPLGILHGMVSRAVTHPRFRQSKDLRVLRARWLLVRNGYLKKARRFSSKPTQFDKASKRMIAIMWIRNIDYNLQLTDKPWHPCKEFG